MLKVSPENANPIGSWLATRFSVVGAPSSSLFRTTGLPPIANFTIMAWIRLVVDRNAFSNWFCYGTSDSHVSYLMGTTLNGTTAKLDNDISETTGLALTVGTWYHMAMTVQGTGANQFKGYINGALNITKAGNSAIPAQKLRLDDYSNTETEPFNGRMAAVKVFNIALTRQQIWDEMKQYVPVYWNYLNSWYPLGISNDLRLKDFGPYKRDLSDEGGTKTLEAPPPIVWQYSKSLQIAKPRLNAVNTYPGYYSNMGGWF